MNLTAESKWIYKSEYDYDYEYEYECECELKCKPDWECKHENE